LISCSHNALKNLHHSIDSRLRLREAWSAVDFDVERPVALDANRFGKLKMDEWKSISAHEAVQRFMALILICLAILALIALAVWHVT
jgi:hypothetical protein